MASCITDQWTSTNPPQAKLTVTQSSETATTATLKWTLQYIVRTASTATADKEWSVSINGKTVKTGAYDVYGKTGTNTVATGTVTISKTHSAQTIPFNVSFSFNMTWSGVYGGTKTASGSISVSAQTSYTIKYSANGGTGAPSSQKQWHGESVELSTKVPTRTNYNFLGWGLSSTTTKVSYDPGDSYGRNASNTLYAIWELAYTAPKIKSVKAIRCAADGTADDFGAYAKVTFSWSVDTTTTNAVSAVTIKHKAAADTAWVSTAANASGTSGSVSQVIGGSLSTESAYNIQISVTDTAGGTSSANSNIGGAVFPIDFLAGGKGVAVGKPSTKADSFEVGFTQYDKFDTMVGNGLATYHGSSNLIDPDTTTEHLILTSKNTPMGDGVFMYITTVFYTTKSATTARAQTAIPYKSNGSMYHRYYYDGAWTAWRRHVNADEGVKLLWSGSWSSGTKVVADIGDYDFFLFDMENSGTRLFVGKEGSRLRGGNMFTTTAGVTYLETINVTFSGTTLTYQYHQVRTISASNAVAISDSGDAIVSIYGVK